MKKKLTKQEQETIDQEINSVLFSHQWLYKNANERIDKLKFLIDQGGNINKLNDKEDSILHQLAFHDGHAKILKFLIENGAKAEDLLLKKINEGHPNIQLHAKNLLKAAVLITSLFKKNGIENIDEELQEELKNNLVKEFEFTISLELEDFEEKYTETIKFSNESYETCFQNLLIIELKSAIAKGVNATTDLLQIVNNNIQELKSVSNIDFSEIYHDVLNNYQLFKNGDYSILSLQTIVSINILKLLQAEELTEKQIQTTLTKDSFDRLEALKNMQNNADEDIITTAGQTEPDSVIVD